jgi:hypothetical protein
MSSYCSLHRLPRAGVDPINTRELALEVLMTVASEPLRHETIAMLLDHQRRGISVLVVTGTTPFDAMFDVLDVVAGLDIAEIGSIVLASVRPPGPHDGAQDLDERDVDRWLEASALVDEHGLELVEWFVIGREVSCPRDLFGEPARW